MKVSVTNNLLTCYPEVAKSIDFDATMKVWNKDSKKYVYAPCLEYCFKIAPSTNKRAIFKCLKNPGHDNWDTMINNRVRENSCPQCTGLVVSKENNLLGCYPEVAKSIDFYKTAKAWEQNPKKYVHVTCLEDCFKIAPSTNKRAIFKCLKNPQHDNWDAIIHSRTLLGADCPQCAANKTASNEEKDFRDELVKILQLKDNEYKTNVKIIPSFKTDFRNNLELDFVCEKLGIAVEFNGTYWHSNEVIENKIGVSADFYHCYKFRQAKKLGLILLFVQEKDWKNNKKIVLEAIKDYCFKHTEIPKILQLPISPC